MLCYMLCYQKIQKTFRNVFAITSHDDFSQILLTLTLTWELNTRPTSCPVGRLNVDEQSLFPPIASLYVCGVGLAVDSLRVRMPAVARWLGR